MLKADYFNVDRRRPAPAPASAPALSPRPQPPPSAPALSPRPHPPPSFPAPIPCPHPCPHPLPSSPALVHALPSPLAVSGGAASQPGAESLEGAAYCDMLWSQVTEPARRRVTRGGSEAADQPAWPDEPARPSRRSSSRPSSPSRVTARAPRAPLARPGSVVSLPAAGPSLSHAVCLPAGPACVRDADVPTRRGSWYRRRRRRLRCPTSVADWDLFAIRQTLFRIRHTRLVNLSSGVCAARRQGRAQMGHRGSTSAADRPRWMGADGVSRTGAWPGGQA